MIVILGCWGSFYFSTFFRSHKILDDIVFSHFFYYVGVIAIILGATIRAYAVWSLRHSFTLSVQTDSKQQLVSTGIYHYIRNPAYTGIILSMLGNTFCFRSLFSPFVVL